MSMRVISREVASSWSNGRAAQNHTGQFWTDGEKLYSYRLQIGDTSTDSGTGESVKVLRDYSANGKHGFQSMTTSKHVGFARRYADIID